MSTERFRGDIMQPPKVCGCYKRVCKHFYANQRAMLLADADRHTTEETAGGLLGGPSQQTYFHWTNGKLLMPDSDRRNWRHMDRKAQRL